MLKKISYIFKRSPCKKCIVSACCTTKCYQYKIYQQRYDIIKLPFYIILMVGLILFVIIPLAILVLLFRETGCCYNKMSLKHIIIINEEEVKIMAETFRRFIKIYQEQGTKAVEAK